MATKKKSAIEEALGFLSNTAKSAKNTLSSGFSNLKSDYTSWSKNYEDKQQQKQQRIKSFLSDTVGQNFPRSVRDFSTSIKNTYNPQIVKTSVMYNPFEKTLDKATNATTKFFTPKWDNGGFWSTPAADKLANVQRGIKAFPGDVKNIGIPTTIGGSKLMTSALLDESAQSYRTPLMKPSFAGPGWAMAKQLLPKDWKEKIAFFLEDKADVIKEKGLQDFSEANDYVISHPTSVNTENMNLLQKMGEPEWWSRSIASNGVNTLASGAIAMGTGFLTGNPVLAAMAAYGTSYMMEGGGLYYDALQNGAPEEEARKISLIGAPIIAVFDFIVPGEWGETIAMRQTLKKLAIKDFIALSIKNGTVEAVTESAQEFILNTLAKYGVSYAGIQAYDPERPLFANVLESGVSAFPMGAGGTTVSTVLSGQQGNIPQTEVIEEQLDQADLDEKLVAVETKTSPQVQAIADSVYFNTVQNGGVTINLAGDIPGEGFAYAPSKLTETEIDTTKFSRQDAVDFIEKYYDNILQPGNNVGTYINDKGNPVLDVSRVGNYSSDTLAEAQGAQQISVYDLKAKKEIPLGKIENGVYNMVDEATSIFNQWAGENQGAIGERSVGGIPEVSEGIISDQAARTEEITPAESPAEVERVEDTEDFQLAMGALKNFRNYNADMYSTPVTTPTDAELGLETLAKYKGYKPVAMETMEQLTPEAAERINQLNETRSEFVKQTGDIEDTLRNYDFYTKRFGELMTRKEILSLKRELQKLIKTIDKEIGQLEKQTVQVEKPALTDDELAMQALEKSRTPVTEIVEEAVAETVDISKEPVEKKEKFGKDIQEQMDVSSVTIKDKNGDLQEIDTGRGLLSRLVNGTKGWNKEIQNKFADWANSLSTAFAGEIRVKESFAQYDSEGIDGILAIQKGEAGHKGVREFFDTWYNKLTKANIPVGYWENYMPGVWDTWENSGKETDKAFSRKVSKTPNFTKEKVFENIQQGIDAGLTPKYKTISQLAGYYERVAQLALANKKFSDYLYQNKFMVQDRNAPPSWKNLDSQAFFKYETKTDKGTYRGMYKASPELADAINVILGKPSPVLEATAKAMSAIKGVILSSGIPGTGISFHSFNVLDRYVQSANNPLGKALKGSWWMLNPNAASKTVKANPARFEEFIAAGMTGSSEDQGMGTVAKEVQGNLVKKGYIKMRNWQQKTFEFNLFQKIIPAMKLDFAENTYQKLVSKGLETKEAMRQAAALTNEEFGGLNLAQIARNKDFQNLLRTIFLASDWMETNVRLGKGLVQAVTPNILGKVKIKGKSISTRSQLTTGQKMIYTRMIRNLLITTIVYGIFGKILSDKWPWENEKGNEFNIDTGLYTNNGQKIYLRPHGTAVDYIRLPFEIAQAAMSGDFSVAAKTIKNRLSPLVSFGMGLLNDTDYAGNPIGWKGVDKYGNPMSPTQRFGGITNQFMGLGFPSFVKSPIDYLTGRVSVEEAITRAVELPVRYSGGAFTEKQKEEKDLIKTGGGTNKEVFDYFKSEKETAKLKKEATKAFKNEDAVGLDKWLNEIFNKQTGEEERMELIKIKYKFSDVAEKKAEGVVEKAKLEKEKLLLSKNIWNNSEEIPGMTDEEKTSLVEELGFKAEDIDYYNTASEENSIKFSFVEDLLSRTESSEKIATLVALRYEVGNKMILADGVINDLYEYGYITSAEKKYLKSIMWDKKKETFRKETGASSGTSKKVSAKMPSYKAPKLSTLKLTGYSLGANPIKAGALTSNLPKMPAISTKAGYQMSNLIPLAIRNEMPLGLSQIGR